MVLVFTSHFHQEHDEASLHNVRLSLYLLYLDENLQKLCALPFYLLLWFSDNYLYLLIPLKLCYYYMCHCNLIYYGTLLHFSV